MPAFARSSSRSFGQGSGYHIAHAWILHGSDLSAIEGSVRRKYDSARPSGFPLERDSTNGASTLEAAGPRLTA